MGKRVAHYIHAAPTELGSTASALVSERQDWLRPAGGAGHKPETRQAGWKMTLREWHGEVRFLSDVWLWTQAAEPTGPPNNGPLRRFRLAWI
ncbi:MAG: hypothetical protein FJ387_31170 [Verrucomicrobia bacterium]|nr:hypothetical protein [Verrucomicrobiota bacterium]